MEPKRLEGHVRLIRAVNAADDYPFVIEVEDESSGLRFLDIEISPAEFVKAFIRNESAKVTFTFRGFDFIGKTREFKTIRVEIPDGMRGHSGTWDAFIREAVKPFEIDGWKADEHELNHYNHYKTTYDHKEYVMLMVRYVDGDA